jgi:D-alanyl-D-alanine carboxypeptidase
VHYSCVHLRANFQHFSSSLILAAGLYLGCTPAIPTKPDPVPGATGRASSTGSDANKPPPTTPESPDPVPASPPDATPVPPAQPRLAWVNPARCLPICAFDPSPQLVRINDQAEPDEKGRHRVTAETQSALRELLRAARTAGHKLRVESAFRSYEDQARLFSSIKEIGRAARPGHSEHQLGSTVDLHLPTGASLSWLAEHAAEFAFALSYPPNKQRITGYRPEPWHIRHVGRELALELRTTRLTLEELFRMRPALAETGTCADCPLPASRAACDNTPTGGICTGNVLSWCYDGALARVDCGLSSQRCGRPNPDAAFDCLPPEVAARLP